MGCQSGLAGARFDIKMRLVKSSAFFVDKGIDVDYKRSRCWRVGREARQRTANPSTAVRIRYLPFGLSKESLFFCHVMHRPPKHHRLRVAINREGVLFVFFWLALGAAAIYSGNAGLMILFCMLTAAFAAARSRSAIPRRHLCTTQCTCRRVDDKSRGDSSLWIAFVREIRRCALHRTDLCGAFSAGRNGESSVYVHLRRAWRCAVFDI